jgi:putative Mg2+ transporter-C (MgtC) family protein
MVDSSKVIFLELNDSTHILRVLLRLGLAAVVGGILGFERELEHKRAGLRTHMLVALGSALFALIAAEVNGEVSRVIQGIATGIGFIGAGTIFKLTEQGEIKGLTSAAAIWVTAAVGTAVGVGLVWPVIVAVVLAWIIMMVLHRLEDWIRPHGPS